jgi:hypothetical protein
MKMFVFSYFAVDLIFFRFDNSIFMVRIADRKMQFDPFIFPDKYLQNGNVRFYTGYQTIYGAFK